MISVIDINSDMEITWSGAVDEDGVSLVGVTGTWALVTADGVGLDSGDLTADGVDTYTGFVPSAATASHVSEGDRLELVCRLEDSSGRVGRIVVQLIARDRRN